jgi:HlyD family secretion protein
LGTVSQGVVTYNVKVAFDTQDSRVRSGMSVSAAIINNVKTDVLTVPVAAVKSSGDTSYVEVLPGVSATAAASILGVSGTGNGGSLTVTSATPPQQQAVVTGISDGTNTEIVSGLNEGDQVVSRTITGGTSTTSGATPARAGGISLPGFGRGG